MYLDGKTILLTGGTGSFGQKFVELVLKDADPASIRVYSRGEHRQLEMQQRFNDDRLRFFIGDVRDRDRLYRAMNGADIVVHAAALKQVPLAEYNPIEAVKTNIEGAINVIDAAIDNKVEKILAISTDKAVHPENLYGATKLVMEKLLIQGNAYTGGRKTRFSCARYGNVLGSQGSVIPLFIKQRENGSVTLTDQRMTRFWLSLEQGVRFVINCLEQMHGGEIFVPKIPSMTMIDMVTAIAPNCQVEVIGIRPGEKLHEELISEDEARLTVDVEDMYVIKPSHPWWQGANWAQGKPVKEGFRYASNTNSWTYTPEQLQELLRKEGWDC
ncbi:MAG: UDP-N-acetylglucosamine 4,6-dehydratase (inverting) [Thermacetogeniaceae bacterium]